MNSAMTGTDGTAPGLSRGWSILLIVVGFVALALPLQAGVAVAIAVAVLVEVSAVAHLAGAYAARSAGAFLWRLLVGGAYLVAGGYLFIHPQLSLLSLTLALAVLFLVEGVFHVVAYFSLRRAPGAGWILFDGIVTIILGLMIWRSWPSSAVWAVGTLLGVNLLISGFSRLMYARTVRVLR